MGILKSLFGGKKKHSCCDVRITEVKEHDCCKNGKKTAEDESNSNSKSCCKK